MNRPDSDSNLHSVEDYGYNNTDELPSQVYDYESGESVRVAGPVEWLTDKATRLMNRLEDLPRGVELKDDDKSPIGSQQVKSRLPAILEEFMVELQRRKSFTDMYTQWAGVPKKAAYFAFLDRIMGRVQPNYFRKAIEQCGVDTKDERKFKPIYEFLRRESPLDESPISWNAERHVRMRFLGFVKSRESKYRIDELLDSEEEITLKLNASKVNTGTTGSSESTSETTPSGTSTTETPPTSTVGKQALKILGIILEQTCTKIKKDAELMSLRDLFSGKSEKGKDDKEPGEGGAKFDPDSDDPVSMLKKHIDNDTAGGDFRTAKKFVKEFNENAFALHKFLLRPQDGLNPFATAPDGYKIIIKYILESLNANAKRYAEKFKLMKNTNVKKYVDFDMMSLNPKDLKQAVTRGLQEGETVLNESLKLITTLKAPYDEDTMEFGCNYHWLKHHFGDLVSDLNEYSSYTILNGLNLKDRPGIQFLFTKYVTNPVAKELAVALGIKENKTLEAFLDLLTDRGALQSTLKKEIQNPIKLSETFKNKEGITFEKVLEIAKGSDTRQVSAVIKLVQGGWMVKHIRNQLGLNVEDLDYDISENEAKNILKDAPTEAATSREEQSTEAAPMEEDEINGKYTEKGFLKWLNNQKKSIQKVQNGAFLVFDASPIDDKVQKFEVSGIPHIQIGEVETAIFQSGTRLRVTARAFEQESSIIDQVKTQSTSGVGFTLDALPKFSDQGKPELGRYDLVSITIHEGGEEPTASAESGSLQLPRITGARDPIRKITALNHDEGWKKKRTEFISGGQFPNVDQMGGLFDRHGFHELSVSVISKTHKDLWAEASEPMVFGLRNVEPEPINELIKSYMFLNGTDESNLLVEFRKDKGAIRIFEDGRFTDGANRLINEDLTPTEVAEITEGDTGRLDPESNESNKNEQPEQGFNPPIFASGVTNATSPYDARTFERELLQSLNRPEVARSETEFKGSNSALNENDIAAIRSAAGSEEWFSVTVDKVGLTKDGIKYHGIDGKFQNFDLINVVLWYLNLDKSKISIFMSPGSSSEEKRLVWDDGHVVNEGEGLEVVPDAYELADGDQQKFQEARSAGKLGSGKNLKKIFDDAKTKKEDVVMRIVNVGRSLSKKRTRGGRSLDRYDGFTVSSVEQVQVVLFNYGIDLDDVEFLNYPRESDDIKAYLDDTPYDQINMDQIKILIGYPRYHLEDTFDPESKGLLQAVDDNYLIPVGTGNEYSLVIPKKYAGIESTANFEILYSKGKKVSPPYDITHLPVLSGSPAVIATSFNSGLGIHQITKKGEVEPFDQPKGKSPSKEAGPQPSTTDKKKDAGESDTPEPEQVEEKARGEKSPRTSKLGTAIPDLAGDFSEVDIESSDVKQLMDIADALTDSYNKSASYITSLDDKFEVNSLKSFMELVQLIMNPAASKTAEVFRTYNVSEGKDTKALGEIFKLNDALQRIKNAINAAIKDQNAKLIIPEIGETFDRVSMTALSPIGSSKTNKIVALQTIGYNISGEQVLPSVYTGAPEPDRSKTRTSSVYSKNLRSKYSPDDDIEYLIAHDPHLIWT